MNIYKFFLHFFYMLKIFLVFLHRNDFTQWGDKIKIDNTDEYLAA